MNRISPFAAAPSQAAVDDGLPLPRRYWAIAGQVVGVFLAVLEGSIANLALPTLAKTFQVDAATAVWVIITYQLVITISLFPLASLGDRIGHAKVFLAGVAVFTTASLACAMAPSFGVLVAARAVQGLGGSAVMAVFLALIRFIYPRKMLGRAIAYNTLIVALSATIGPTIAATILSQASWPWLFLINIPLGVVVFAIGIVAFPQTPHAPGRFDFAGAALSALAFGSLVLALDSPRRGDPLGVLIGALAVSVILFAILVWHQSRRSAPLLPLDLFAIRIVRLSAFTAIACYVVQSLCYISLPFLFHETFDFGFMAVGAAMTPWPIAIAIVSPLAGRLADRYPVGLLGLVGLVLLALGLLSLVLLPAHPSYPNIAWRMALCGLGFGLFQAPNSRAILANSPPTRTGGASAIQSGARLAGQASGAALASLVFGLAAGDKPHAALIAALGFAILACVISAMRPLK